MDRFACAVIAAVGVLVLTGCDSCKAGSDDAEGGSGGTGPGSGGGTTGAFTDTTGTGSGGCIECSADLHAVLDCDGNVILTCPPDQGCSPDGTCVPACQSAELNKSTIGCDFYSMTPGVIAESRGSCFAVMIANTWTSPIAIQAEYGAMSIDASAYTYLPVDSGGTITYQPLTGGMLGPGELGILFLSKYESFDIFQVDCPVAQALEMNTHVDDGTNNYVGVTGLGQAFHITTTAPIVAYDVYPWGGASSFVTSATLLVPTPTWGTNFVTADGWGPMYGNPWTQIVAAQDATTVTMVPIVDVVGGNGLPGGPANTPMTFTLNRGQAAQFLQPTRLAGSVLQADKPVSVWGGSSCMNIPDGQVACDAGHQQLLPVQALGNEYAAVRYPPRGGDDQAPYMIVGMVDGTNLVYDPVAPPGAPATVNQGQVSVFFTDQPFLVRSQDADHPFYMAAYMTGGGGNGGIGDPEYVNLVPPEQYLNDYLFVTDPTYANTSLVFVRKKAPDGLFKDVTLQGCMTPVTGWQPLDAAGNFEIARIMIVQNFQPVGTCKNGVQVAESEVPFGLTVWGYDQYASYGYPGGMSVEPINTVVVPPVPQ